MAPRSKTPGDKPYPYYLSKKGGPDAPPVTSIKKKYGKSITVFVPERQLKKLSLIDNPSDFFQLALANAISIMTWAKMKEEWPRTYYDLPQTEAEEKRVFDEYNYHHPKPEDRRLRKTITNLELPSEEEQMSEEDTPCQTNSQSKPETW